MCVLCSKIFNKEYLYIDDRVVLSYDQFPVTEGHALIYPIRCVKSYFDLNTWEKERVDVFIREYVKAMEQTDHSIEGWNIGWNCGRAAGQTVMHAHCHVIPRRKGDCICPTGGVRNALGTELGDYTKWE